MNKILIYVVCITFLCIVEAKADTGQSIGAVIDGLKNLAYLLTALSWVSLYLMIRKMQGMYFLASLAIGIVCYFIGMEAVKNGNYLMEDINYKDVGQSFITWGYTIIVLNALPIVIAIVQHVINVEATRDE